MRSHEIGYVAQQILAEYKESPGLRLSSWQVQKLWGLDETRAEAVLAALIDARALRLARDGTYVRSE